MGISKKILIEEGRGPNVFVVEKIKKGGGIFSKYKTQIL